MNQGIKIHLADSLSELVRRKGDDPQQIAVDADHARGDVATVERAETLEVGGRNGGPVGVGGQVPEKADQLLGNPEPVEHVRRGQNRRVLLLY